MRLDQSSKNCVLKSYHKTDLRSHPGNPNDSEMKTGECPFKAQFDRLKTDSTKEGENECIVSTVCKIKDLERLPDDLLELMPAILEPLPPDYNMPPAPAWLDVEKLKKGQSFARKNMNGLNYADSLALMFLFSSADGLKPLIYTGKSHTPLLAQKRYLSTYFRVWSWYETEIWNPESEGYKNLKCVRALHLNVSNKLNSLSVAEVHQGSNLEEKLKRENAEMLCPLSSTLRKDFKSNGPVYPVRMPSSARIYLNQLEMAFTQFGFFGLMLLHPEKFGAKNATEEELSCFVHLWRYIGYMLGIRDEYNQCRGELSEVKQRSAHMIEYFLRPMMLEVNKEWEHMSRCALQGIEKFTKLHINFECTILYLCWVLDIETPHLLQYVGWKEQTLFSLTKLVMTESYKIPGFSRFANYTVRRNIENSAKEEKRAKKKQIK